MITPFGKYGYCTTVKVNPEEMNEILEGWKGGGAAEKVLLKNEIPTAGIKQYLNYYYRDQRASTFYGFTGGYPTCYIVGNGTDNDSTDATQAWITFQQVISNNGYPSLKYMFETVDKRFWSFFTRCVPSYLNYFNEDKKGSYIECVQKADVSSAFGYELSKPLPTMRGYIESLFREEPTKEYPFAFYRDGTMAIYNEFDSKNWNKEVYDFDYCQIQREKRCYEYSYPKNSIEPMTILCKASTMNLKSIVEDIYQKKLNDNTAFYKSVLNYSVGMMWRCKCPSFVHVAAVVIARCVDRMLKAYDTIVANDGTPILIATDSIAWEGNPLALPYTTTKYLGAMVLEHEDCELWGSGAKAYQIRDTDGTVTTKWSGKPREETDKMDFGDLPPTATGDIMYCYNPKEKKFIIMESGYGENY